MLKSVQGKKKQIQGGKEFAKQLNFNTGSGQLCV